MMNKIRLYITSVRKERDSTKGGANASHRATQASPQAPAGLGHSVSVTFAEAGK